MRYTFKITGTLEAVNEDAAESLLEKMLSNPAVGADTNIEVEEDINNEDEESEEEEEEAK